MAVTAISDSKLKFVLYAEDDRDDVFLFHRATRVFDGQLKFGVVSDGRIAIDWLSGDGPFTDRDQFPLPDVVITDLKMPMAGGFDVLRFVRAHPKLKELLVVIHSSSNLQRDIAQAYALNATVYIVKDPRCDGLVQFLRRYVEAFPAIAPK